MSRGLPQLIVFDLDACLWSPEMFELDSAPTRYEDRLGGTRAGNDVVRLFPGAQVVLKRILLDPSFRNVQIGVASSTTYPAYAATCLETLRIDPSGERLETLSDLVDYREIYYGNKGRQHIPALSKESGVDFNEYTIL